jgi:hypothetical protein
MTCAPATIAGHSVALSFIGRILSVVPALSPFLPLQTQSMFCRLHRNCMDARLLFNFGGSHCQRLKTKPCRSLCRRPPDVKRKNSQWPRTHMAVPVNMGTVCVPRKNGGARPCPGRDNSHKAPSARNLCRTKNQKLFLSSVRCDIFYSWPPQVTELRRPYLFR